MNKLFGLCIALLLLQSGNAQRADSVYLFSYFKGNGEDGLHLAYSNDGYQWQALKNDSSFLTPQVAKDKLMRDPCIIHGADHRFHMVWTVSWNDRGIGYASSPDLLHWSQQQFIPVMKVEPNARNCWAPEIFYDAPSSRYMIYWASTIPGRFMEGDTAGDDKYNHRLYYVTTNDFNTFSKTALLYNQGFNVIDATIQRSGKQYIMFLKDETKKPPQKNLRIAISDSLSTGYGKPSAPITGKYWAEGPTVITIKGEWFVYFDKYTEHRYGAVKSADLLHWTDISASVHFPEGTRHGTVFTLSRKEFDQLQAAAGR
ncbi:MAG TPA: glycoside hydrolase family 43 protein [Chitinophagaceae bacterium]|nr:glycoside hydrolase family 43 protein [Chitinophagaceae bacterium]